MKILCTGAAGFIGSVVTESLIERGHQVITLDNLKYGHRAAVHPQSLFIQMDLNSPDLRPMMKQYRFDAIVHLAADTVLAESMRDPGMFYRTNVGGAMNLLDAMDASGCKRMIFSSTAAVYGLPKQVPVSEVAPLNPATPYGETKMVVERLLEWYRQLKGVQYIAFRYFNACGASTKYGDYHVPETHIISVLLETVLGLRESFQLFGADYPTPDGTCIRDYVHVKDIAQAHLLALEQIDKLGSSIYNLGNMRGYSNREVIAAVEQVTGKTIKVDKAQRRPADPPELIASSDKARGMLGWNPKYTDLTAMVETAWLWRQAHPKGYE